MSFTVTATNGNGAALKMSMGVYVLTGVNSSSPVGQTAFAYDSGISTSITPTYSNSVVFGTMNARNTSTTGTITYESGTNAQWSTNFNTNGYASVGFNTGTTTAGTPMTVGLTDTGDWTATFETITLAEIVAAAGKSIAIDASGPTVPSGSFVNGSVASVTSASFTPSPSSYVLLAQVCSQSNDAPNLYLSDTSGLGIVWSCVASGGYAQNGYASTIWIGVPGQTTFTVTASATNLNSSEGIALCVVPIGGSPSGIGATAKTATTIGASSPYPAALSITPNDSGSLVLGTAFIAFASTPLYAATSTTGLSYCGVAPSSSSTYQFGAYEESSAYLAGFVSTSTTTASTPVTLGVDGPSGNSGRHYVEALCEITGSSLTVQNGTYVQSSVSNSVTTPKFAPAAGSTLVALLYGYNNGSSAPVFSLSDTSGLGLTWTQQVQEDTTTTYQISTAIYTAQMPPVFSGSPTATTSYTATNTGSKVDSGSPHASAAFTASNTGHKSETQAPDATAAFTASCTGTKTSSGSGTASISLFTEEYAPVAFINLVAYSSFSTVNPSPRGSWWQYLDILKEQQYEFDYYATIPPWACPNCGEPLLPGPYGAMSILFCKYDGWQYPRDYVRPQRS